MTTSQNSHRFTGRTRIITVVSIIAIGIAGATAVSANMGSSSGGSNVGNVSAADLTSPQVVDVYLPPSTTTAAMTAAGVQEFTVDTAGTVAVAATTAGIRLDTVTATAGWTWSLAQTDSSNLTVTLTNGTRTLEFVATLNADGTIGASVNEPIVTAAQPANAGAPAGGDDGGHEGGESDD
jgi:hypothetical protein